jgi:putative endonuclease
VGHKQYWIYLVTNYERTVLYTGITNSLERRIAQHKSGAFQGFTKTYRCDRLVYFEEFSEVDQAIAREKQIKGWTRTRKNELIRHVNPQWNDLAADWYSEGPSLRSG